MASENRSQYVITVPGPWNLYTHKLQGWEMLGSVQRGVEIGALGKSPAGIYAQINAGAIQQLEQRKVIAAFQSK